MSEFNFWNWFDAKAREAKSTAVGHVMTAAGYEVHHTGGGCLAWRKSTPDGFEAWICDEENGLGDLLRETYLVGFYDSDGNFAKTDQGEVPSLRAALLWCDMRLTKHGVAAVDVNALVEPDLPKETVATILKAIPQSKGVLQETVAKRTGLKAFELREALIKMKEQHYLNYNYGPRGVVWFRVTRKAPKMEKKIGIDRIAPAHIAQAAHKKSCDVAIRYLQNIAGITDGGIAGLWFNDRIWGELDHYGRIDRIHLWLKDESH